MSCIPASTLGGVGKVNVACWLAASLTAALLVASSVVVDPSSLRTYSERAVLMLLVLPRATVTDLMEAAGGGSPSTCSPHFIRYCRQLNVPKAAILAGSPSRKTGEPTVFSWGVDAAWVISMRGAIPVPSWETVR